MYNFDEKAINAFDDLEKINLRGVGEKEFKFKKIKK